MGDKVGRGYVNLPKDSEISFKKGMNAINTTKDTLLRLNEPSNCHQYPQTHPNAPFSPLVHFPAQLINPPNDSILQLTYFMMLNEEELADEQLNRLEDIINDKIDLIRKVLQEQDRSIVEEIVMKKSHSTDPIYPKYDKKNCYYQEFWKVYLLNEIMIAKIKEYSDGNKVLVKEVQELEDAEKEWSTIWTQKSKKKIRRTSDMIDKIFQCPFERCSRNYGSDVSLNLHMKLKHNSGTKTERENLAKEICLAEEKGTRIKITLNFPPGYLQEFRENFRKENLI